MRRFLIVLLASVLCSACAFAQETADPMANMAIPDQPAEVTASNREASTDDAAAENPLDQPGETVTPANTPPVIEVRVPSNLPTKNDSGQDNASEYPITVFPLKHADASNIIRILGELLGKRGLDMTVDNRLNALVVSADAATMRQVEGLLKALDAPEGAKPASQSSGSSGMFGRGRGGLPGSRGGFGGGSSRPTNRSTAATRPPLKPAFDTSPSASIDELRKAYAHYDEQAKQAAANVRASDKPGRTVMIRLSVKRAFEIRQKLQRAELAEFEKRLDSIRQSIETRDRIAEQIIDRRVEELLDPNLKWDSTKLESSVSSESELIAEKEATSSKETQFGDPQHGLKMALVSSEENTPGDRVLNVSFVVQNVTEQLQQFELAGLTPECDVRRTSKAQVETKLSGRSGRNPVTVRLQPGQQAAISTLRIRVTDDVAVESVPQDSDLLIVDRNAFKFRNVVYVLKCTQPVRIDGSEVSLSSAPIAIAFSRPTSESKDATRLNSSELERLQGEWYFVGMSGGDESVEPSQLSGMKWSINGNTITATQPGHMGKMEFKLNLKTTPKQFDLTGKWQPTAALGIYELKNNQLSICFDNSGKTRPRDFSDAAKKGNTLITLEKAGASSDADGESSAEQPAQLTPAEEGIQLRVLRRGRPVADNVVIRGSEGYTGLPLPSVSETPSHKGVISLDKLEKGQTHWLLVRPSTVLRLDLAPVADAYYERELPKRANLVGKDLDVDVYVQKTESDEFLLVSVLNRTKEEIAFSEADFHLMTAIKGPGADTRVYSPVWKKIAEGKEPITMTVQPGERHAFRLDWQDWVKNGFWFSRADETIAEPAFAPMEPGKTWVRLTLGSAKPVAVTHPDVIIGSGQAGDAEEANSPKFETHEVALAYTSRKALLDLDTGKTLGPIARGAPSQVPEFDVYADWGPESKVVLVGQLHKAIRNARLADATSWKDPSRMRILEQLKQLPAAEAGATQILADQDDKEPKYWVVETKQGGAAILEVEYKGDIKTELSGIQKGFIVRYKLLPAQNNAEPQDAAKSEVKEFQEELQQIQSLEESAEQKKGNQREQILRQAMEKYSAFYQKRRTQMAGLYARYYYGRCLRKLGEDNQARGVSCELRDLPTEPEAIKKLQNAVREEFKRLHAA